MNGFLIKKAFFDGWDNLIGLIIFNVGYLLILFLLMGSMTLGQYSMVYTFLGLVVVALLYSVYSGGVSHVTCGYADYQRDSFVSFKKGIIRNWKHSLLYFFVNLIMLSIAILVIPFYYSMANMVGLIIAVLLFWIEVILLLAMPYYFPLTERLPGDRPLKTFKKCFIILGDNMLFSVFYGIYHLIMFALTIASIGLIPGYAGMMLAHQDAIKLRMMKYDYLEENPDADRKHLPWADLLYDEEEKVGPRTLKGMIFPWKD